MSMYRRMQHGFIQANKIIVVNVLDLIRQQNRLRCDQIQWTLFCRECNDKLTATE